jgi:hypothetical protein
LPGKKEKARLMRKDIEFPIVEQVYVAALKEWDAEFLSQSWYAYLINNSDQQLDIAMVVSRGNNTALKTATLRHAFGTIMPKSSKKIELLMEEVLTFTNEFLVTYFIEDKLYEKTFVFPPNSISEKNNQEIPLLELEGVLAD